MSQGSAPAARLPLRSLNHVSRLCRDVAASAAFYADVLGFALIKRPESFGFDGAWLFSNSLGIHLIKGEPLTKPGPIIPKSDHLSFQSDNLAEVEERLQRSNIPFVKQTVNEGGFQVSQIFFHDPDGFMIEVCNCDVLPIEFLDPDALACSACVTCPTQQQQQEEQQAEDMECGASDSSCDTTTAPHSPLRRACSLLAQHQQQLQAFAVRASYAGADAGDELRLGACPIRRSCSLASGLNLVAAGSGLLA